MIAIDSKILAMSSASVLVVDDEPNIREVIRIALESGGFRVIEAEHVEAARQAIGAQRPDLVLLDWLLPGCSGLDLARQLRGDPKTCTLPIIMVSARSDEADRIRGLETGADDFIAKPFSPREMVSRVNAVLRRIDLVQTRIPRHPRLQITGLYREP